MSEVTAQVSRSIAAPPATVWQALVTPAMIKQYFFGSNVESDFQVGSPIHWRGEFNGKKYEDSGEILQAEPGTRLRMSHWSPLSGTPDTPENHHVVTFDLAPDGKDTRVTLSQSNLLGAVRQEDGKRRAEFEKNWSAVLDGLAKAVETASA